MPRRRYVTAPAVLLLLSVFGAVAWALSYWDRFFSHDGRVLAYRVDRSTAGGDSYLLSRPDEGRSVATWFDLFRPNYVYKFADRNLRHQSALSISQARFGFESHRGSATFSRRAHRFASGNATVFIETDSGTFTFRLVAVPYWALVLPPGLLAAALWVAAMIRRRLRARPGLCPGCGYDLRGSRDSERCPECGLPIRRRPVANAVAAPAGEPAAAPAP